MLAACAIKVLGGDFQGRVDPQRPDEARRVRAAGISTGVLTADEIVAGPALFAAAAVTGGPLLARPGDELVLTLLRQRQPHDPDRDQRRSGGSG